MASPTAGSGHKARNFRLPRWELSPVDDLDFAPESDQPIPRHQDRQPHIPAIAIDLESAAPGTVNQFVVFGEPNVERIEEGEMLRVRIRGVDVFKPQTGEIESSGPEGIACWFIDDAYDEASFFVRHAYFLGANDPYKALKTSLKAEIDEEAWASLNSDTSRPFPKPSTGRIAVKVINHLGDEVMKVFGV